MKTAPPNLWVAWSPFVLRSRKNGSSRLMTSARRCLRNTRKSARNSDAKTTRSDGPAGRSRLVTDLAPGQADEDVLQGDVSVGDLAHSWIVLVLLDQVVWGLRREQLAVVDDRDSIAHRLGLLHRVRSQEDAPALLAQVLDPAPQLTPGLRVQTRRRLRKQPERGGVDNRDL